MAVLKNPISEAKRYITNARQILSQNGGKSGNYYSDPKYVKMAGNTAWSGVLVALDGCFGVKKNMSKSKRVDIDVYKNIVAKKDKKMSRNFNTAYDSLHKALGYDGNLRYSIVQDAIKQGEEIIAWANKHYQPQ